MYSFLFQELEELGGTVPIVLDKVDHTSDDSLLYKLPRAQSDGDVDSIRLGIIGISNGLRFRNQLSSKVRSSLYEKEVSFAAYDADELLKILRQREGVAFHDDVVNEGVIHVCAAYGAKDSGDARQALDLLLENGDIAREQNAEQVIEAHVQEARDRLQADQVVQGISNYPLHGKLVLLALTVLAEQDQTPARTRDVCPAYNSICTQEGTDPISNRATSEYLSELETLGIISSKNRIWKGVAGSTNRIRWRSRQRAFGGD